MGDEREKKEEVVGEEEKTRRIGAGRGEEVWEEEEDEEEGEEMGEEEKERKMVGFRLGGALTVLTVKYTASDAAAGTPADSSRAAGQCADRRGGAERVERKGGGGGEERRGGGSEGGTVEKAEEKEEVWEERREVVKGRRERRGVG